VKRIIAITFVFLIGLFACQNANTPEAPEVKDCVKYNTATIQFENRSVTNRTYDVVWDGVHIATIGPWEKTQVFTVAAGEHTMTFKVSNSGKLACTTAYPVLQQCGVYSYFCTG